MIEDQGQSLHLLKMKENEEVKLRKYKCIDNFNLRSDHRNENIKFGNIITIG